MTEKNRLYYLDNLKTLMILLVIIHHAGQAYGLTGGTWLYSYPGERAKSLILLFLFNASFFMGLFFFISGYFFPASFDRHGARKFITDKLIRFGIPLVFAALLMVPALEFIKYVHYTSHISFQDFYIRHWLRLVPDAKASRQIFNIGPLWFVEHLLVYAVLYTAMRIVLKKCAPSFSISTVRRAPVYAIVLFIAFLGTTTYLMRVTWGFPIDRWIFFLGLVQMEPAHIPQYLSLFILGILAYRYSFLESITTPRNMLWFIPGLGIYLFAVIQLYTSGRQSVSFLWEFKEALLCVGVSIGLLALFRTFFNRTGPVLKILAENSYGTYVIHLPVVVGLQYAFDPVRAGAFTLFVIVSVLSIIGSFFGSFLLRLIPGVRRVL